MPCKGDELCCDDETRDADFDSSPKLTENGCSSNDNIASTNHATPSFDIPHQPPQQSKSLTNGNNSHDGPRQIFIERKAHPSGISFESVSPLPGEELKPNGVTDMSNCRVFVSNYRIVIITQNRHGLSSIPLIGIDSLEAFDETLKIICKDGRIFTICSETQEIAMNWYKLVAPLVSGAHKLNDVFAFKFAFKFAMSCMKQRPMYLKKIGSSILNTKHSLQREFDNCEFNKDEWRISSVNEEFKVCPSYPQFLIIPKATTDKELLELKRGRFFDRFPTAIWRNKQTGAVLLRSSQPEISFFGTSQEGDTRLFEAIRNVTVNEKRKKIIVIDARSYGAALANRAKGGGFEGGDSYFGTEISFMNLPNIHSLRYSFHQLRQLLNSSVDSNGYFQALNTSQWFQYLFNLIISSQRCVDALSDGLSVLVHCSDGWDRTTQIVSLVKVISDPYYRTFEGFEHLIMREWVEFGHKFSDRNGMTGSDTNERSPVFMQFLDAVNQLWLKNPDMFEFNQRYLMKLAQHQYSAMFGTFLFNNYLELLKQNEFSIQQSGLCFDKDSVDKNNTATLISVFDYLNKQNPTFINPVFDPRKTSRLACPGKIWELQIYRQVYCCSSVEENVNNPDNVCASALNDLSIHGDNTTSEKIPTVSRSQSAASLNSLEQTTNGIHCNVNSGNHSTPNGANAASYVSSSYSTISYINSRRDAYPAWKTFIDVDGLTKVAIDYEDRVIEIQRQMAKNENRSGSESSVKQNDGHPMVVLRHRVESNDSSMFSFDVLDDMEIGRKKRDSTCSSNVVFEFCSQRNTSDALISPLNEEELVRCEHCQNDMADENVETNHKNGVNKCSRCTNQVIPRSSNQVVVS